MNRITVNFRESRGTINPNIYGHFAEHIGGVFYDGLWVGEDSRVENVRGFRKALVDSFKKLNPPVLRWPGGCFAETYDWRDGIGPRAQRPRRVNWWYYCDGRVEPNEVGTHEFMDFCRMTGAAPYVAANMTSTTPLHIRDWVEYCNFPAGTTTLADERARNGSPEPFDVRLWGIGNENWGGGGQMTPEMCAREFIRYTTVMRSLGTKSLRFIMCGANGHDVEWTRRLMREWSARRWHEVETYGVSIHYYTNQGSKADPLNFTEDEWYDQLLRAAFMQQVIDDHRAAMDEFDPDRRIKLIVDEWGCWHRDGTGPSKGYNLFEQQSTMRDALVAALTLNIFNNRCDVVDMANVAQLCNNLHSLYLAGGEHFVETPNYHVFDLFKGHQGARQLCLHMDVPMLEREGFRPTPRISASASEKDGVLTLTLGNLDMTASQEVRLAGLYGSIAGSAQVSVLSADKPTACNTFEEPFAVVPHTSDLQLEEGAVLTLPAASVTLVRVQLARG